MYLEEAKALLERASKVFDEQLRFIEPYGAGSSTHESCSTPALGIHLKSHNTYQLAVRLMHESDRFLVQPILDEIGQNKIDLRVTGPIVPFAFPTNPKIAIAHRGGWRSGVGRCGSIGCLVRKRGQSELLILSNNHILANTNNARESDPIIHLGTIGMTLGSRINSYIPFSNSHKNIASLKEFVDIKFNKLNLVDAAIANLNQNDMYIDRIRSLCKLKGFHDDDGQGFFPQLDKVYKRGIKTGFTEGKINSVIKEMPMNYTRDGSKSCKFINVLEIISDKPNEHFSLPGDSGAVIHDRDGYAVALLLGGISREKLTFAISIKAVLDALDIDLVLDL